MKTNKVKFKKSRLRKKSAFSLIELSVVILIISILAAGAMSFSTVALLNSKTKVTNDKMKAIYNALGTFVAKNYRLPCPASLKLTKSNAGYGAEAGSNNCTEGDGIYSSTLESELIYGMVPVKALGLADEMAEDGFGTKIAYIVNANLTKAEYPSETDDSGFSFSETDDEKLVKIYQLPSTNEIDNNAFVLISHGANKYGGVNSNSNSQNNISGADSYEVSNILTNITENVAPTIDTASFGVISGFANHVVITAQNSNSDIFDDIVFFKSREQILQDFNLGFLLPCTSDTDNHRENTGIDVAYSGQLKYGTTNCVDPSSQIPSQRCAPFASSWVDVDVCISYPTN